VNTRIALVLFLISLLPTVAYGQPAYLERRLSIVPEVVPIDGKPTAYLEYDLTNISGDTLQLTGLALQERNTSKVVTALDHAAIRSRMAPLNGALLKQDQTLLAPRETKIVYLEFIFETIEPKTFFTSVFAFDVLHHGKREPQHADAYFYVGKKAPLTLGPPLREGNWVAVYDPSWMRGHRRVLFRGDVQMHLPGRYAIDFLRTDDQGRFAKGNADEIKNWYGYGADVLAVSDGTVLSVRNDFSESATLSGHTQPPSNDATGNYISLGIGHEQVVFYEHLKPGSIRVTEGQQVKKGDVIASLGFTGQSTGPHLHLHVADQNTPLLAEGIPFVFDRFTVLGVYNDAAKLGKERWSPKDSDKARMKERPAPNTVIIFK
jgi:hypothetical protein